MEGIHEKRSLVARMTVAILKTGDATMPVMDLTSFKRILREVDRLTSNCRNSTRMDSCNLCRFSYFLANC